MRGKVDVVLLAIALTTGADPALAQEALWEGTWTPDPQRNCIMPESDGAPLVVASSTPKSGLYWQYTTEGGEQSLTGEHGQIEFIRGADPYVCYITKVTTIVSLPAWIVDVQCGGEGEIWETRHVLLSGASGDELAYYDGSQTSILQRCSAADLLRPFGTNDKYGGNINATHGRGYIFLELKEALGESQVAYRVTTLYRDAVVSSRHTSIVSCDPAHGDTGVADLTGGEIYIVAPDDPPAEFSPEMGNFDLWWITCRDQLHSTSPLPDWTREIASRLAPIEPPN